MHVSIPSFLQSCEIKTTREHTRNIDLYQKSIYLVIRSAVSFPIYFNPCIVVLFMYSLKVFLMTKNK